MFADELVGREAFEGLEPSPEVVGADEVGEVLAQLVVIVVMEAFDGRVLDRAIPLPGSGLPANRERDPLDLAIRPGVLDLGQPVVDLMLAADPVADVLAGMNVPIVVGELAAVIGQHDVDAVRHSGGQVA